MKKTTSSVLALGALLLTLLPGCSTNTQGDSASPVFLVGFITSEGLFLARLCAAATLLSLSLIHISEPTRPY